MWVEHAADAPEAFNKVGAKPVILEAPADFVRELSVIAAVVIGLKDGVQVSAERSSR